MIFLISKVVQYNNFKQINKLFELSDLVNRAVMHLYPDLVKTRLLSQIRYIKLRIVICECHHYLLILLLTLLMHVIF